MKKILSTKERGVLLASLEARFKQNKQRHRNIIWTDVLSRLEENPEKLYSLNEMEKTGGEPDVVCQDSKTKEYIFMDCSAETPVGRRSVCYDHPALESRKEHRPKNSAMDMAKAMGVEILSEKDYRNLQTLGEFDLKTSSWIRTPRDIRELGGALFCDRRFGHVFVYHNGAQSYYSARAFRASLHV
ncbi:MAG: DUF4256 domain-containing protein [Chthoniobacterales bacterium]